MKRFTNVKIFRPLIVGQCRHHQVTVEEPGYQLEARVKQIHMAEDVRQGMEQSK